jgi:hypothetical protein
MLRYAKLRCVQNLPREARLVAPAAKLLDEFFEEAPMLPYCQTFDIFEDKVRGPEFGHNPDKLANKAVPGIVQRPMADQGKPLARCATKNDVDATASDACTPPDLVPSETHNRLRQDGATRKIICVDGAMDGIDFNSGDNIEASLFEA